MSDIIENPEVAAVINTYPPKMRKKIMSLRRLVLATASGSDEVQGLEETLKWGEPSFVTKTGSTIRVAWKEARPDHYAMFFNCQTKLVDTFRELYPGKFKFEGNRAILFHENDKIPVTELENCIELALTYHRRKKLWMLGM